MDIVKGLTNISLLQSDITIGELLSMNILKKFYSLSDKNQADNFKEAIKDLKLRYDVKNEDTLKEVLAKINR